MDKDHPAASENRPVKRRLKKTEWHEQKKTMTLLNSNSKNPNQTVLKWLSLVTLTFQNAVLGLSMRYARTQPGDLFISSTAVVIAELVKFLSCLVLTFFQEGSIVKWLHTLNTQIIRQPIDTLKVSVPSLVYTLQNNLLYVAASNLDAATYQVTYQLKILTTAIFSVIMLKKSLGVMQWVALVLLLIGVSMVQLAESNAPSVAGGHKQNPLLGLIAVVISCCMSGFAGVYFEKILKSTNEVSVWMRNIQLSFLAIPIGLLTSYVNDHEEIHERGFFFGYNKVVWFVVAMQALGGLLVAVVVKYADNILKGFATSLAIIVSCVASIYLFEFRVTVQFAVGTLLVIASIFMYGHQPSDKKTTATRSGVLSKV
uniref:Sugar phosphate transporter domain-containing protein n=1 Tax=Strigamia maritima TaxID=126957 RepID=T1IWB2_STRMM